jgi:hypothetical protein
LCRKCACSRGFSSIETSEWAALRPALHFTPPITGTGGLGGFGSGGGGANTGGLSVAFGGSGGSGDGETPRSLEAAVLG